MATIITKNSGTASSVPTGAQLTAGELAVNTADKRLFTKNGGGTVVELGTNPSSLTLPNGTANGVPYLNASKVLTSGSALTFDGNGLSIGTGAAQSVSTINGGTTGGAIKGQRAGVNQWFLGDTAAALGSGTGLISFLYNNDPFIWYSNSTEQMRLTSTGLGIGTSSPSTALDVASASGSPIISLTASGAWRYQILTDRSTKTFRIRDQSAGDADRVILDQAGNLGLGVTPSAWSGYGAVLQMQNGGAFVNNALNDVHVANNCYYNAGWKYTATNASSRYEQFNGGHYWFSAPSGTAGNAITFTQAMTLDASGTLAVGQRIKSTGNAAPASGSGPELFWDGATGGVLSYNRTSSTYLPLGFDGSDIRFYTTSGERARIDSSGNLLRGQTVSGNNNSNGFYSDTAGYFGQNHISGTGSGAVFAYFGYAGGSIGTITQNGTTGVLYNLTSDYRLKNNPVPVTGAKEFINALQPKTWDWWDGSGKGVGFIAHEFMEVAKYSGNGTKDAVDDDGNPVYQSIQPSSSEVMANLVAYVQELRAEFDAYKAAHP